MVSKQLRMRIVFLCAIAMISCTESNKKNVTINQPSLPISSLTKLALDHGDTTAYEQLSIAYMDSPDPCFLYTALLMANRHNFKLAEMDVFYCLTDYYHQRADDTLVLEAIDDRTRNMAINYLKLAAEKGEPNAKTIYGLFLRNGKYVRTNDEKSEKMQGE